MFKNVNDKSSKDCSTTITNYPFYDYAKKYKISILVPVYNDDDIIEEIIENIDSILNKLPFEYSIFIVNDGSGNKQREAAGLIQKKYSKVSLLDYEEGPTRRENLAQSFKKTPGDIIIFVDADLSSSLNSLPILINEIALGYDIVTGSRYIAGSSIKRKTFRLVASILYNNFIKLIFKTNIHDHMCGFKAFRREVILKLVEEMGYDRSLKRGIFWDTEMLIRAMRNGYKIKEIPIIWLERNKSALRFNREIKAIPYIIKFKREID